MQSEELIATGEQAKVPSIAKSTAKMSVATTFSRSTGFLRNMALAAALGDSLINDTFTTANVMPNIMFELLMGGVLGSVIIPVYVQYLAEKSDDESGYMISNLTNIIFMFAAVLSLIGVIFSPYFVKLMTMFEPSRATPLMVMFFRVFALQVMFYALTAVFSGVLNSHRRFTMPMTAPVLNNLVVVGTVFGLYLPYHKSNPQFALLALAIGTTAGVVAMALSQLPSAIKAGLKLRFVLDFKHPAVRQVGKLGLPMLGFAVIYQINTFITYMLLQTHKSWALAYANALAFFQLPYAIFVVSVTTAIFPELSRFANSKDFTSFKKTLSMGLRSASFIAIPSAVFVAVMAKPIIGLTLEHGKFSKAGTEVTAAMLSAFAFALLSFSLYNMLTRVYYSLQDTKTPLKIGATSVPLQIALNFLFIKVFGVWGLPLAYAVALTLSVLAQLYILRAKIGPIGASIILRAMAKHLGAAIPAGVVMYLVFYGIEHMSIARMLAQAVEIAAAGMLGGLVYLGLALLFGVKEVDFIKSLSRKVFGRISNDHLTASN